MAQPTNDDNVFCSLFDHRPREQITSEENFLTEALVYSLRSCDLAARKWVYLVTDGRVQPTKRPEFKTRASAWENGSYAPCYPDLTVTGENHLGEPYRVLVEHKWASPYREEQLSRYAKLRERGETLHLAFVCAKADDHRQARSSFKAPRQVQFTAKTWQDVYECLGAVKSDDIFLKQFMEFMAAQGLSPGRAISGEDLRIFTQGVASPERARAIRDRMRHYCERLLNEYDWSDILPPSYRNKTVRDQGNLGRTAAIFWCDYNRGPELSAGFYYDQRDHKVPFVDPKKGIDLHLRLYAIPQSKNASAVNDVQELLRDRIPALKKLGVTVRLKDDPRNGNRWTLLFAAKSVSDIVRGKKTEGEQVAAIYEELSQWCGALFTNPEVLERAFEKLKTGGRFDEPPI